jgi:serine/threonine protein kinase
MISTGIVCKFEFIHSKRFVQRDLKPENCLLEKYGQSCIGDLGSSTLLERMNRLSTDKNTIAYATPEF